ncbi:MAG TPA: DUF1587 domain-containing protein, partial [Planctomycetaceae bacterium]|nr:DUF1587 domain-containing protein [Planctomycetaceae bacterium]
MGGCTVVVVCALGLAQLSARGGDNKESAPTPPAAQPAAQPISATAFRETIQPLLRKYCFECHGNDTTNGGVNFESFSDVASAVAARKTWAKARKMLERGAMPPADHPTRPSEAEVASVLRWINQGVFDDDCGKFHDPGHVTIRRLNRAEYNNTIRDLLGVRLRPADDFPSDDVGNGFDNQGEVLSISPLLMEGYLAAAERVSSVALFGVDLKKPPIARLDVRKMSLAGAAQLARKRFARERYVWLPTVGAVSGTFQCPKSGEYVFRIIAAARQAGGELPRLEVHVDEAAPHVFDVTGESVLGHYELRMNLASGPHKFSAAFKNAIAEPPAPPALPRLAAARRDAKAAERVKPAREIELSRLELEGPFAIDPRDPAQASIETRKRILAADPGENDPLAERVALVLTRFARRAFRRPVERVEIKPYVDLA